VNPGTILLLIRKDWYLFRLVISLYMLGAVAGAVLAAQQSESLRTFGLTLLVNVLIGLSFHLPFGTIFGERDHRTLAFVLSLPVTPRDHTGGKLFGNLALFLAPMLAAAVAFTFWGVSRSSSEYVVVFRLVPLALGVFLAFYSWVLAVALLTESVGATMAFLLVSIFILGNGAIQLLPRIPAVVAWVDAALAGKSAFPITLGAEGLLVGLAVAMSLWGSARKTSFL
jgi:ABC-2 type transport system permease protein